MAKISNPASLGRAIRSVRKALGLTQDELALTSGTNRRLVIEMEAGKATAHIGKVLRVLQALGMGLEATPPPGIELTDGPVEGREPDDGPPA